MTYFDYWCNTRRGSVSNYQYSYPYNYMYMPYSQSWLNYRY